MSKGLKILLLAAFALVMAQSAAYAINPDTFVVRVLIRYLSVDVDDAKDDYDFGIVELSSQNVSSDITITNDGNAAEDFTLQITGSPANLIVEEANATPDDVDEYQLYANFDSDGVGITWNYPQDLILESAAKQTDVAFLGGDTTANDVPAGESRDLYVMFYAPPSLSAGHPQQVITVTVTAVAA